MAELTDDGEGPDQPPGAGPASPPGARRERPERRVRGARRYPTQGKHADSRSFPRGGQPAGRAPCPEANRGLLRREVPGCHAHARRRVPRGRRGDGLPPRPTPFGRPLLPDADRPRDVEPRSAMGGCDRRPGDRGRALERPPLPAVRPPSLVERDLPLRCVPLGRGPPGDPAPDHRRAVGAPGPGGGRDERSPRAERGQGHAPPRGLARSEGAARRHPRVRPDPASRRADRADRGRTLDDARHDRAGRQEDEQARGRPAGPRPARPRAHPARARADRRQRAGPPRRS